MYSTSKYLTPGIIILNLLALVPPGYAKTAHLEFIRQTSLTISTLNIQAQAPTANDYLALHNKV